MISTSSHENWKTEMYITYAISGNRGKDVNYQGKCYDSYRQIACFLRCDADMVEE